MRRRSQKKRTWSDTPAKASVCLRLCLAGGNQRKMTCYILIWMNTEEKYREESSKAVEFQEMPYRCLFYLDEY